MNCPEHSVVYNRFFHIWMYYVDIPRERIPWHIWLNPLRYQVTIMRKYPKRSITINREGLWNVRFSNFCYRLKKRIWGKK